MRPYTEKQIVGSKGKDMIHACQFVEVWNHGRQHNTHQTKYTPEARWSWHHPVAPSHNTIQTVTWFFFRQIILRPRWSFGPGGLALSFHLNHPSGCSKVLLVSSFTLLSELSRPRDTTAVPSVAAHIVAKETKRQHLLSLDVNIILVGSY